MRHRRAGKKLGRDTSHRRALMRNMVASLFKYEQLETTDAKAKQLRPVAEKMITLAKRGDLNARRQALSYINDKTITHRLFEQLKERYVDREGGYLRVIKKGNRRGDGAPISIVQLIPENEGAKKGRKKRKVKPGRAAESKIKKKETKAKEGKKSDPKKDTKGGVKASKQDKKKKPS